VLGGMIPPIVVTILGQADNVEETIKRVQGELTKFAESGPYDAQLGAQANEEYIQKGIKTAQDLIVPNYQSKVYNAQLGAVASEPYIQQGITTAQGLVVPGWQAKTFDAKLTAQANEVLIQQGIKTATGLVVPGWQDKHFYAALGVKAPVSLLIAEIQKAHTETQKIASEYPVDLALGVELAKQVPGQLKGAQTKAQTLASSDPVKLPIIAASKILKINAALAAAERAAQARANADPIKLPIVPDTKLLKINAAIAAAERAAQAKADAEPVEIPVTAKTEEGASFWKTFLTTAGLSDAGAGAGRGFGAAFLGGFGGWLGAKLPGVLGSVFAVGGIHGFRVAELGVTLAGQLGRGFLGAMARGGSVFTEMTTGMVTDFLAMNQVLPSLHAAVSAYQSYVEETAVSKESSGQVRQQAIYAAHSYWLAYLKALQNAPPGLGGGPNSPLGKTVQAYVKFDTQFDKAYRGATLGANTFVQNLLKSTEKALGILGSFAQQNYDIINKLTAGKGGIFSWISSSTNKGQLTAASEQVRQLSQELYQLEHPSGGGRPDQHRIAQVTKELQAAQTAMDKIMANPKTGGLAVLNVLETMFTGDLPTGVKTFTLAFQDFAKTMAALSPTNGNILETIYNWLKKISTDKGFQAWMKKVQGWVSEFDQWLGLLKAVYNSIAGLFSGGKDAGTSNMFLKSLTAFFNSLAAWENSKSGSAMLKNLFQLHKTQLKDVLTLIQQFLLALKAVGPGVVLGFTAVTTAVLSFITKLATIKIPAAVMTGIGNMFTGLASTLKQSTDPIVSALGKVLTAVGQFIKGIGAFSIAEGLGVVLVLKKLSVLKFAGFGLEKLGALTGFLGKIVALGGEKMGLPILEDLGNMLGTTGQGIKGIGGKLNPNTLAANTSAVQDNTAAIGTLTDRLSTAFPGGGGGSVLTGGVGTAEEDASHLGLIAGLLKGVLQVSLVGAGLVMLASMLEGINKMTGGRLAQVLQTPERLMGKAWDATFAHIFGAWAGSTGGSAEVARNNQNATAYLKEISGELKNLGSVKPGQLQSLITGLYSHLTVPGSLYTSVANKLSGELARVKAQLAATNAKNTADSRYLADLEQIIETGKSGNMAGLSPFQRNQVYSLRKMKLGSPGQLKQALADLQFLSGHSGGLGSGLDTEITNMIAQVKTMAERAKPTIKATFEQSVGHPIQTGTVKGIQAYQGKVNAAAKDAQHQALQAAKKAIGASSPAKVYIQLGDASMQGYIKGLSKPVYIAQERAVFTKVKNTADTFFKAMNHEMEQMGADLMTSVAHGIERNVGAVSQALAKTLVPAMQTGLTQAMQATTRTLVMDLRRGMV